MAFQSIFEPFEQQASPFTANDTLGTMFTAPKKKKRQRRQGQAATAEEESALRKIGQMGLSGITSAAATLDWDSAALRNMLVGKAPSLDPFSFENRTTGRDILQHYLPIPKNIEGFHPIDQPLDALLDVAGLGTEIGLDWKTYATGGAAAVGRAGKAFRRAGLWDFVPEAAAKYGVKTGYKTGEKGAGKAFGRMASRQNLTAKNVLAAMPSDIRKVAKGKLSSQANQLGVPLKQLWNEPLGGALGFWPTGGVVGKAGGVGGKVAALLDPIAEAVRYGKYSPVRGAYAALSPAMDGRADAVLQKSLKAGSAAAKFRAHNITSIGHEGVYAAHDMGFLPQNSRTAAAINTSHRDYIETLGHEGAPTDILGGVDDASRDSMKQLLRDAAERSGPVAAENEKRWGIDLHELFEEMDEDFVPFNYLARFAHRFEFPLDASTGVHGVKHDSLIRRNNALRPLPSKLINEMSLDQKLSGIWHSTKFGDYSKLSSRTRDRLIYDVMKSRNITEEVAAEMLDAVSPMLPGVTRPKSDIQKLMKAKNLTKKQAAEVVKGAFPRLSKKDVNLDQAVDYIIKTYGDQLPDDYKHTFSLAETITGLDPQYHLTGTPLFSNNPLVDALRREKMSNKSIGTAQTIYGHIGQFAQVGKQIDTDVSLGQAVRESGLKGGQMADRMKEHLPKDMWVEAKQKITTDRNRLVKWIDESPEERSMFWETVREKYGEKSGKEAAELTTQAGGVPSTGPLSKETILDNIYVPKEQADNIKRLGGMTRSNKLPETIIDEVMKFHDSSLTVTKGHLTSYWPQFMNRNLSMGQIQAVIAGHYGSNIFGRDGIFASLKDTWHMIHGKNIPNVLDIPIVKEAGITDVREATRFVTAQLAGITGRLKNEFADQTGSLASSATRNIAAETPGMYPWSLREAFKKLIPGPQSGKRKRWKVPWAIEGAFGAKDTEFFMSQFGNEMSYGVETFNRMAPALSMLRRGVDPAEIVRRVNLAQVDYAATAVGDKYMRRMIPFFSFTKGMSKYLATELTQKPGGPLAQTIRAEGWLSREAAPQIIPDYMQTSATIPLGESAEGDPRILTSLGMMHEDPLQFLATQKGSIPSQIGNMALNVGREFLGRTSPAIKSVVEPITGVSTWQYGARGGRNLEDMYGYLGGFASKAAGKKITLPPFAENIPSVLGIGRYVSTAGQLAHPDRAWWVKALNVGVGPKVTTIKPHMQDRVIEENIQEKMQKLGAKQYKKMYFPKSLTKDLSEKELQERNELKALNSAMQRRRRERAAQQPLF